METSNKVKNQLSSWKFNLKRYGVPRIAYINKMDREGARLERVIENMKDKLKATPALLQVPIGEGINFSTMVDLLDMQV
jgi:elongation factor G